MQATSLRVPVASYTSDDEDDRQRCQHPGSGASGGATGSHSGNSGNANSSHSEKGLARLRSTNGILLIRRLREETFRPFLVRFISL